MAEDYFEVVKKHREEKEIMLNKYNELIDVHKGRRVSVKIAKEIYKVAKSICTITELRLDMTSSIVFVQPYIWNEKVGLESLFMVEGLKGKRLSMNDEKA